MVPPHPHALISSLSVISLDRALLIDWSDYPGLTDYLVPQSFDWNRLDILENLTVPSVPRDVGSWRAAKEHGKSSRWYLSTNLSAFFDNSVEVFQGHRYDYTYALLRNPTLMPRAYALGVDRVRCSICCAFQYLFKINSTFERTMNSLLATIRFPPDPYIAVHLADSVSSKVADEHVKCAVKASKELHVLHPNILPVSDDQFITNSLIKRHSQIIQSITVVSSVANHTHIGALPLKVEPTALDAAQESTFRDFFVMLNSSVLVRGKGYRSALGNIADALRHHWNRPGSHITYVTSGGLCQRAIEGAKIE